MGDTAKSVAPIERGPNRIPLIAGMLTFAAHAVCNPHYGFFRDELYFIVCGRHPAFGYVDQPPVAPLLAAATQIFGPSLLLLRLVPAFFAGAAVFVGCTLAVELGGAAFAQVIAALVVFLAPVLMSFGMKASPDTIGLWLWPLAALWVLRIVKGESPRLWLAIGAILGICAESKYSVLYFATALVAGLLLTPQRRVLFSKWFAGAVALAVVIALPNFLWQAEHGFPIVELLRNGQAGKNVMLGPAAYVGEQFLITNVFLALVWVAGIVFLLWKPLTRFLGLAYLILIAMMIASHAKHYYPADIYPILIAAGGAAIEQWTQRARWIRPLAAAVVVAGGLVFVPFALPVLSEVHFIQYANAVNTILHINSATAKTENLQLGALPQDWADMHGWPELAATVARVYDSLPAADRVGAFVFTGNYGEAAAVEFFEPHVPVASGHNQYWLWGTRGLSGNVTIQVGGDCGVRQHVFKSAVRAATFSAPYVMPYENDLPIMVCRGLRVPLTGVWPSVKHYE